MTRFAAKASMIVALALIPTAASAATPTELVTSQFRHVALHRVMVAADVDAAHVRTGCLQRRRYIWTCGAAVFDQYNLVAGVFQFRFKSLAGTSGYTGPKGPHWIMNLPYGRRAHRHLHGYITGIFIGQPELEGPS
jgi:hypothetical protein